MAGLAGERGDDVARVEAAGRRFHRATTRRFSTPRAGGVSEAGKAAHPVRAGLGAAHLEIVGDVVCQAVQRGIASQAEDVVDAVVLAPVHRLVAAVMAVPPEGEPGARPVPADAAGQVLQQDADLDPRRRLAGAQEDRHWPAALDMVDVHREEAAGVVEGVEQRELLVAVHRVAGLVDVEHDRRRRDREGAAEDVDQGGRQARHLSARGRVLEPAHGRLGTQIAAALRRPADRKLEQRIGAQLVAPELVEGRRRPRSRRRSRTCGTGASPAACEPSAPDRATPGCSQPASRPGRAGAPPRAAAPARRPTRSNRQRNRRSPSCGLRLEDRTGEGYLRSWRAWRFRCFGRNPLGNEFLPDVNGLRHVRRYFIPGCRISRASWQQG